ncbi:MAG: hypothetical protein CML68_01800 [Rhodobacteraceae bacterium]|nr:hypothetical protein [Paracoccaceae bacterium]
MGDVRLRRHPTHHPLGVALMCWLLGGAASAGVLDVSVWGEAAQRCLAAIETGERFDAEGFVLGHGSVDPETGGLVTGMLTSGDINVFMKRLSTGAGEPIRVCSVGVSHRLSDTQVRLIDDNAEAWMQQVRDSGRFEDGKTRRKVADGRVVALKSTEPNVRGCHMTSLYIATFDMPAVSIEIKERPGVECGKADKVGGEDKR